ncbi:zf-HC2 domain-containing protein [soil metagenome]
MTTIDHARVTEWDAAYVLGALSPAERHEFEEHLDECERCRAAVSELSALPGLLGRIDEARAFALLEREDGDGDGDAEADESLDISEPIESGNIVSIASARARSKRIRRTLISVVALAAAAALASVLTLAIPPLLAPKSHPDAFSAFAAASGQPVNFDAAVKLTSTGWGTRLEMDCSYHPVANADGGYGTATYSLWVVGKDGSEQQVSTWRASPGSEALVDAGTATPLNDIAQLDLRTADGGTVLMSGLIDLDHFS